MKFFFFFVGRPLMYLRCLYTPVATDDRTTSDTSGRPPPYLRFSGHSVSGLWTLGSWWLTVQLRNSGRPPPHSVLGSWLGFDVSVLILLCGCVVSTVYIYSSCVANWSESIFCCSSKGLFSWPKIFFFKSLWRAHARKEEGKLCGEVVKTRCETIRHNGPVFIWCIKSIYNEETMNLQLFERYMSKKCNFVWEWCGNGAGWRKHVILRGKYDLDSAKCSSVCGLSYAMSRISFQSHLLSHLWIPVFFFSERKNGWMDGLHDLFFSWVDG